MQADSENKQSPERFNSQNVSQKHPFEDAITDAATTGCSLQVPWALSVATATGHLMFPLLDPRD